MATANEDLLKVLRQWVENRDAREKHFSELNYRDVGSFDRAVAAITPMIRDALSTRHENGQVGRSFVEVVPDIFRSKGVEVTNEEVEQLIERSLTDFYSFQQLEYLAINPLFLLQLPSLKDWQERVFLGIIQKPKRPKGAHKNANFFRDHAICSAIRRLEKAGFRPTRGKVVVDQSACDVVATALQRCNRPLTYDAIEKVWKNRRKIDVADGGRDLADALADTMLRRLGNNN